jgi:hypothetical protein
MRSSGDLSSESHKTDRILLLQGRLVVAPLAAESFSSAFSVSGMATDAALFSSSTASNAGVDMMKQFM